MGTTIINNNSVPKKNKYIIFRNIIDNKIILYNEQNGSLYCFNETGKLIWNMIDGNKNVKEIIKLIENKYEFSSKKIENKIIDFLNTLIKHDLATINEKDFSLLENNSSEIINDTVAIYKFINHHSGIYYPISVLYELTYNCNEKCIHCYQDCKETKRKRDLDTNSVKKIVNGLYKAGTFFIIFSGGEPFIRNDFYTILEYTKKLNFSIDIFSNGTLIKKTDAKLIKDLNINKIHISLYSLNSKIHDNITRVSGSHKKTLEAIKFLRAENVKVSIKCPIMKDNYVDYYKLKDYVKSIGCEVNINPLITPRDNGDITPQNLMINDDEIQNVLLDDDFKKSEKISCFRKNSFDLSKIIPCNIFYTGASISANGKVYPCNQLRIEIGDLSRNTFKNIWIKSKKLNNLRKIRMSDIEKCNTCNLFKFCTRCPGLAWLESGDVNGISSIACRFAAVREKLGIVQKNNNYLTIAFQKTRSLKIKY